MTGRIGIAAVPAVLAVLLGLPLLLGGGYVLHVFSVTYIFVVLAVGLDLVMGFAGQFSFAQGAFYGIGAYTAAILHRDFGTGFWLHLPAGMLVAGGFGLLLALPALRLSGHFLAIVTIAFQTIVYLILLQWTSFTGGPYGIMVPPASGFASTESFYYLALGVAAATLLLAWALAGSRLGREWQSLRDDELLARAIGLNTTRAKLAAFVAAAALAGAAGVLIAHDVQGVSPDDFSIATSAAVIAMVLVGGRGTLVGPVLGAAFFTAMPEALRFTADYRLIIYGSLMIVMIVAMPEGVVGTMLRRWRA